MNDAAFFKRLIARFERSYVPEPMSGCWLWEALCFDDEYGIFSVRKHMMRAHRFSWELHRGPIPHRLLVCHRCDNKYCVNPDHLFLGTHQDNVMDMWSKGRNRPVSHEPTVFGEAHPRAILTESDVVIMRELRSGGESVASIGRRFGVSRATASAAIRGQSWKCIPLTPRQAPIHVGL